MEKKVFITGITGKLGSRVCEFYKSKNYLVSGVSIDYPYNDDIRDKDKLIRKIIEYSPDLIIHTAALVDADYCEIQKEEAYNINFQGTKNVAIACKQVKAFLINLSSDFVFDGTCGPYYEEDITNPINFYGKTKLDAELMLKELLPENHCTIRTCVLYDWNEKTKPNFVMWLVNNLKAGKVVNIVTDQYANPTYIPDLVEVLYSVGENRINQTIHVCGKDRLNRYEFALKVADYFGLNKNLIIPTNSFFLNQIAKRPLSAGLNTKKAEILGLSIKTIDSGLKRLIISASLK